MQESMEILADPAMLARLRAGREAVAHGDVADLEAGSYRVQVVGPVARELAGTVRPALAALAEAPAERGRALGLGLVGTYATDGAGRRILYAVHEPQRLVTVLSVDVTPPA